MHEFFLFPSTIVSGFQELVSQENWQKCVAFVWPSLGSHIVSLPPSSVGWHSDTGLSRWEWREYGRYNMSWQPSLGNKICHTTVQGYYLALTYGFNFISFTSLGPKWYFYISEDQTHFQGTITEVLGRILWRLSNTQRVFLNILNKNIGKTVWTV